MDTTDPLISTPSSPSSKRATVPAAVQATVALALALSRTFLISRCPYFTAPGRSAWPGLGQKMLLASEAPGSQSKGSKTGRHSFRSVFSMDNPRGAPVVRPPLRPPQISSRSFSMRILSPLPYPRLRRDRACSRSFSVTLRPAGRPSTTARRPRPWDSPLVKNLRVTPIHPPFRKKVSLFVLKRLRPHTT